MRGVLTALGIVLGSLVVVLGVVLLEPRPDPSPVMFCQPPSVSVQDTCVQLTSQPPFNPPQH